MRHIKGNGQARNVIRQHFECDKVAVLYQWTVKHFFSNFYTISHAANWSTRKIYSKSTPYRTFLYMLAFFEADTMLRSNPPTPQKRPRFTQQVTFSTNEERDTFVHRFEAVCKLLQPVGAPSLDNHGLLCVMFDAMDRTRDRTLSRVMSAWKQRVF